MVGFIDPCSELGAYILQLSFLDKKGLSIVTKLHVQVYWLSIHFNVDLEEYGKRYKQSNGTKVLSLGNHKEDTLGV